MVGRTARGSLHAHPKCSSGVWNLRPMVFANSLQAAVGRGSQVRQSTQFSPAPEDKAVLCNRGASRAGQQLRPWPRPAQPTAAAGCSTVSTHSMRWPAHSSGGLPPWLLASLPPLLPANPHPVRCMQHESITRKTQQLCAHLSLPWPSPLSPGRPAMSPQKKLWLQHMSGRVAPGMRCHQPNLHFVQRFHTQSPGMHCCSGTKMQPC